MILMNLHDAACWISEEMNLFHDWSMFLLMFIFTMVGVIFYCMITTNYINRFLLHNEGLEIIWILFPCMVLLAIALPSLKILYLADLTEQPDLTIKVIGHQWYWSYQYPDFGGEIEVSSYLLQDFSDENFRSLEVDNRIALPVNKSIRVVATSDDVIHSWTIPALGVKMDSVPGRLNQFLILCERFGIFFGQCSEICGVLHSFMPICVEFIDLKTFLNWIFSSDTW